MNQVPGARHSAFSSAGAQGLDLRAIDRLGITRLVTDSRHVKHGDTFVAYQEANGVRRAFSDAEVARKALRRWAA